MSKSLQENNNIELSVVLLCYGSGRYLEKICTETIDAVSKLDVTYEIIAVVNYDNLPNETNIIAKQISEVYDVIKIVEEKKKGGMGWDMQTGISASSGKFIAIIDGDGQMPVIDIASGFKILKNEKYDLVMTYRNKRFDGYYRKILSDIYGVLFNLLYSKSINKIRDVNSKPKILSRALYESFSIKSNEWFIDSEIVLKAIKMNCTIYQMPTVFYKNQFRTSFISFDSAVNMIYNLLKFLR